MVRRETFLDRYKRRARSHSMNEKPSEPLRGWLGPTWGGIPAYVWILGALIVLGGLVL